MQGYGPGRPASIQPGDVYAGGLGTLHLVSPGYAALAQPEPTDPSVLLAEGANPAWLATAGAGTVALALVLLYLDRRVVRR